MEEATTVKKLIIKQLTLIIIILTFAGILAWYFWLYDEVVTEGKAYGFEIGMNKNDAVSVIKQEFNSKDNALILSPNTGRDPIEGILYTNARDLKEGDVKTYSVWQIRINGKETNVLILFFRESKLIKISRYRRAFIP